MRRFESKKDSWLQVVLYASLLITLVGSYLIWRDGGHLPVLFHIVMQTILWASAALILSVMFGTYYLVGERELIIRSGFMRWRIERSSIQSITLTRDILSSPALSLDRLEIRYGAGKSVLVSPADQAGFVEALGFDLSRRAKGV